ncbi:hypothetical protein [Ascidiimonas aurantiaca]|uniref:hypothetical protein n=1 Tax=Ascidiimonas aurantiaca TaxID=1685432 RepID=UPI0030EF99A5
MRKKEHALRNQKLSGELYTTQIYFDWVITTAFYAAIHFVEHKLLPCEINSIQCKNINEVKSAYGIPGRHSSRERLVFDKLPLDVAVKYKWLDDKSRYSRYVTYKVTKTEADKALSYLQYIQNSCCPKTEKKTKAKK